MLNRRFTLIPALTVIACAAAIAGFPGTVRAQGTAQTAQPTPVRISIGDFTDAVRMRMEEAEADAVWARHFQITGDREAFLRTVRSWLNGVVVDPVHLGTGLDADMGFTQNKGFGAWTRTWRAEESYDYLGHVILRTFDPSNPQSRTTMFHEAIHAYSYATGAGDLDDDSYNGPEFLSGGFIDQIVPYLSAAEKRMEDIVQSAQRCEPGANRKVADWMTDYDKRRFQFYNTQYNDTMGRLIKHLGGKLDWDGYQKEVSDHVQAVLSTIDCTGAASMEDRIRKLRGEVEAFERMVQEGNQWLARAQAQRAEIDAARGAVVQAWVDFIGGLDAGRGDLNGLDKLRRTWFSGIDQRSKEVTMASAWVDLAARRLAQSYSIAERAGKNAEETRAAVCAWSSDSETSAEALKQRQEEAKKRLVVAAGAVDVAFEKVKEDREALVTIARELQSPLKDARGAAQLFRVVAGNSNHKQAFDRFKQSKENFKAVAQNAFTRAGIDPEKIQAQAREIYSQGMRLQNRVQEIRKLPLKPQEAQSVDEIDLILVNAWRSRPVLRAYGQEWWRIPGLEDLEQQTRLEFSTERQEAYWLVEQASEIAARFERLVQLADDAIQRAKGAAEGAMIESLAAGVAIEEAQKCTDILLAMKPGQPGGKIVVPDVAHMKIDKAVGVLKGAGIIHVNPELAGETQDAKLADTVTSQSPAAGESVDKDATVTLQVLIGATQTGNVPNVVGKKLNDAVAVIESAGLVPVIQVGADTTDATREGTISWQGPRAGEQVPLGTDVVIEVYSWVSPGRIVPNVVGQPVSRAGSMLKTRDLFVDRMIEGPAPSPQDEGRIVRQYPEPGREIPEGTGVQVWVYGPYIPPPPPVAIDVPPFRGPRDDIEPNNPPVDSKQPLNSEECKSAYRQIMLLAKSGADLDSLLLQNETYNHCDYMEMTMVLTPFFSSGSYDKFDVDDYLQKIGMMPDHVTGGSGAGGNQPPRKCRGRGVCRDCGVTMGLPTACMHQIEVDIKKKCGDASTNKNWYTCSKQVNSYWLDYYE